MARPAGFEPATPSLEGRKFPIRRYYPGQRGTKRDNGLVCVRSGYADGVIQTQAVLGATGITGDGRRCGLGVALSHRASRSSGTRAATQEGTLHFQHLKREGGLLHLAASLPEHLSQLASLFADPDVTRQGALRFVEAFIRPHGLNTPATERVVEEVERFAAGPALVAEAPSVGTRLLRLSLLPGAAIATVVTMERTKLRAMILHWTRPARLRLRALVSCLIYAARFVRRMPRLLLRLVKTAISRVVVRPVRWGIKRVKTGLHAFLVRRKGEPGHVS